MTLTPVCGSSLSNISGTVTAGGITYNTNTSTISVTHPSLTIDGNASFCTGNTVYSINGTIPCNATVTWSADPPTGIIDLSPNGNSVTVSKTGNGSVTLQATINACNNFSIFKNILVGEPTQVYGGIQPTTYYPNYCVGENYGFELLGANGDADQYDWYAYGPTQSSHYTVYTDQTTVQFTFSEIGSYELVVIGTNACGSEMIATKTVEVESCGWYYAISPNPSSGNIKIAPNTNTASKTNPKSLDIQDIEIVDKMGIIKHRQRFEKGVKTVNLSVSQLSSDIYTLRIFDGQKWHSRKIIVQR